MSGPDEQSPSARRSEPLLAFTVDVEPDWAVGGAAAVQEALPRLLELLERYQARATFFVVADLLKECGELLRRAVPKHEVASHGLSHRLLDRLSAHEVRRELGESRARLSGELAADVVGFRAPFLRVPPGWFELLAEAGYRYDSSLGRVRPSWKNVPPGRWEPVRVGSVVEIAPMSLRTGAIPFSLTYLRLGAPLTPLLAPTRGGVFYLHLHELARPEHVNKLRAPLRWMLARNVGEPAWRILERLLQGWRGRAVTCRRLLNETGFPL